METTDKDVAVSADQVMPNLLLYVARVLRDQLDDLLTSNAQAPGMRSTLEFAAQHILVSHSKNDVVGLQRVTVRARSEELMNSSLPLQLMHSIFARLPVPQIKRMCILSKEWKQSMQTQGSEFWQVCDAVSSSRFALICTGDTDGQFSVKTFDLRTKSWHAFQYTTRRGRSLVTICACDGGLVCFLFKPSKMELEEGWQPEMGISVWNPSTGDEHTLPGLALWNFSHHNFLKLSVDRQRKSFTVTVVSTVRRPHRWSDWGNSTCEHVHVYDSATKEWDKVESKSSHIILFDTQRCPRYFPIPLEHIQSDGVMVYSCGIGRFHFLNNYALTGDHAFMLDINRDRSQVDAISEYSFHAGKSSYTKVKSHRGPPLEKYPRQDCTRLKLHAGKGFLIVQGLSDRMPYRPLLWFYDLATGEWQDLPDFPQEKRPPHVDYHVMCELQWSVIPRDAPLVERT